MGEGVQVQRLGQVDAPFFEQGLQTHAFVPFLTDDCAALVLIQQCECPRSRSCGIDGNGDRSWGNRRGHRSCSRSGSRLDGGRCGTGGGRGRSSGDARLGEFFGNQKPVAIQIILDELRNRAAFPFPPLIEGDLSVIVRVEVLVGIGEQRGDAGASLLGGRAISALSGGRSGSGASTGSGVVSVVPAPVTSVPLSRWQWLGLRRGIFLAIRALKFATAFTALFWPARPATRSTAFFHAPLHALLQLVDADPFAEVRAALLHAIPHAAVHLFGFAGGNDAIVVLVQIRKHLGGVKPSASAEAPPSSAATTAPVSLSGRAPARSLSREAPQREQSEHQAQQAEPADTHDSEFPA